VYSAPLSRLREGYIVRVMLSTVLYVGISNLNHIPGLATYISLFGRRINKHTLLK